MLVVWRFRTGLLATGLSAVAGAYMVLEAERLVSWRHDEQPSALRPSCVLVGGRVGEPGVAAQHARSVGDGVTCRVVSPTPTPSPSLDRLEAGPTAGQLLKMVFHIIHEQTGQEPEKPVTRALREGVVVGLVGHTVLLPAKSLPMQSSP